MKSERILSERQRELVEENLPLIWQTLARYITYSDAVCGLSRDDLFQEGAFALCRAAGSYCSESKVPFSAYARPVIRNHLLDYCRRVQAERRNAPTVPLDMPIYAGQPPPEQWLSEPQDNLETQSDRLCLEQMREYGRRNYHGIAHCGIEAMQLKLLGYTGTEIARLYHTSPNNVGAWIARAAGKLRSDFPNDPGAEEYKQKKAAGF